MSVLRRSSSVARASALLSLGAFCVHQVRYLLAYGHGAGHALAQQGHGYLSELAGVVTVVALAGIAASLVTGALTVRSGTGGPGSAWTRTALLYALVLAAIFCGQELTEGAVAAGHPAGPAAVLANGGWIAFPLALAAGAVCAAAAIALGGVERIIATLVERVAERVRRAPQRTLLPRSLERSPLPSTGLAFGFARRPPPPLPIG